MYSGVSKTHSWLGGQEEGSRDILSIRYSGANKLEIGSRIVDLFQRCKLLPAILHQSSTGTSNVGQEYLQSAGSEGILADRLI